MSSETAIKDELSFEELHKRAVEDALFSFIEEYRKLCKKHGFFVHACGCCDSPWVVSEELSHSSLDEHINHLRQQAKKTGRTSED